MTRGLSIVAVAASLAGVAPVSRAEPIDTPCRVELSLDVPESWRRAAEGLRVLEATDGDCETVRIERADDGSIHVVFVTRDGRATRRRLRDPAELVTTVKLLRIAGPASREPPREPSPVADPQSVEPLVGPPLAGASQRAVDAVDHPGRHRDGVVVGAYVGQRLAKQSSPLIRAGLLWMSSALEVGAIAVIEPKYAAPTETDARRPYDAASGIGAVAGYRLALGPCEGLIEARLLLAATFIRTSAMVSGNTVMEGSTTVELRMGAGFGLVVPRRARARLRADVGLDWVPDRLGASLSLGIELWAR